MEGDYQEKLQQKTRLAEAELSFYSQHAKIKYLKECDKKIKFFHTLVQRNNKQSEISETTIYWTEVVIEFTTHFTNLLGTKTPRSTIDPNLFGHGQLITIDQGGQVTQLFNLEEIIYIYKKSIVQYLR